MHHRFHIHGAGGEGRGGHGRFARRCNEGDRASRRGRARFADLQVSLLALLADKPRFGYEIIQEFAETSPKSSIPSAAMIYPTLTYLGEIGHATVTVEGVRKRYEITEAGRQHLATSRATSEEAPRGRRRLHHSEELWLAGRDLRNALREKAAESVEEQQRLVGILQRTVAEILGKTGN